MTPLHLHAFEVQTCHPIKDFGEFLKEEGPCYYPIMGELLLEYVVHVQSNLHLAYLYNQDGSYRVQRMNIIIHGGSFSQFRVLWGINDTILKFFSWNPHLPNLRKCNIDWASKIITVLNMKLLILGRVESVMESGIGD
ncbi:hypothetical protein H5410_045848 [Solanum commersonii]|uniref:Uncharacterized protein n=1 Tax=Solanum commersonii TaxID=4109 RepID=A0A9J5XDY5_SOLCO|nr:hypothetical protein H5410_045848 [Solanum commersonii]